MTIGGDIQLKTVSAEEIRTMPEGTIVFVRKNIYPKAIKYRIISKNNVKLLEGVFSKRLLTIKHRQTFLYEIEE